MTPQMGVVTPDDVAAAVAAEAAIRAAADAAEVIARNAAIAAHAADLAAHTKNILQLLRTGNYYLPWFVRTLATTALGANFLRTIPLIVARNITIDSIAIEVTTYTVPFNIRLGIYRDGTNLAPGALLLDCGAVAVTGTGIKAASISQALTKGIYHLALVSDGTCTCRTCTLSWPLLGILATDFSVMNDLWYAAFTYGALSGADPFPAPTAGAGAPLIAVKISSLD